MIRARNYNQLGLTVFLSAIILVTFNLLVNFPISYVYTISNITFLVGLSVFFAVKTIDTIKNRKASYLYILMLLLLIVPLYGSIQSFLIYKQPILYGLLTERVKIFGLSGLLLLTLLEKRIVSLNKVRDHMLTWASILFVVLLILNFLVPKSILLNYDFVIDSISKGIRVKFNQTLIVFLFLYLIIKGSAKKNFLFILVALAILIYFIFIYKARSLAISMLLSGFVYFLVNQKVYKNVSLLIILASITTGFFFLAKLLIPEKVNLVLELFYSAFNVFLGGEITDASSLSRVTQVDIAMGGFKDHPFLGNGFLSSQWNDGFQGLYGHFFPSDIGWVGILYLYGVLGIFIYLIPFIWSLKMSISQRQRNSISSSYFVLACYYTILYLFFQNAIAGYFVKKVGIVMFFFALIYYNYYAEKTKLDSK